MDQYPPQMPPSYYPQPGYPPQPQYPPQPGYPPQPQYAPQPGYPPAGYPPYPVQTGYPAPPPSKSRTGMWIAIVIIVVLLLGGGGAVYFVIQGLNSPTATLQKYCDGFKKMDIQEMEDTYSSSTRAKLDQQVSVADRQKFADALKSQGWTTGDCTVSSVQQNGSQATAILTISQMPMTLNNGKFIPTSLKTSQTQVNLIQENGQWKIDNSHVVALAH